MPSDVVRIGIVGAGGIVRQRHMPGLQELPGVEFVSVCNRRRDSAEAFAEEYGIPRVVDHWRQVVDDPRVDVVWIGTTPYMHARISIAALDAGKHVFCQARMARNLAEARAMVAAADRHPELVVAICPPPFGMVGEVTMRRLLRQERVVGDVQQVRLTMLAASLTAGEPELHWRQDIEQSGNNVLTVGIYAEVMHRWVGRAVELQGPHRFVHPPAARSGHRRIRKRADSRFRQRDRSARLRGRLRLPVVRRGASRSHRRAVGLWRRRHAHLRLRRRPHPPRDAE